MKMVNTIGFLTALNFLASLVDANALSSSLTELYRKSQASVSQRGVADITLDSAELFCRKDIGGASSTYTFLDSTTEKVQGICNIDKGRLPLNEAFLFNEISVGYKLGNANIPGGVAYDAALPPALRNASLVIVQKGREVFRGCMASLSNPYTGTCEADNWTQINTLRYISDNEDFRILIEFAPGQSVAAGSSNDYPYLEVRLRGHITAKRTV